MRRARGTMSCRGAGLVVYAGGSQKLAQPSTPLLAYGSVDLSVVRRSLGNVEQESKPSHGTRASLLRGGLIQYNESMIVLRKHVPAKYISWDDAGVLPNLGYMQHATLVLKNYGVFSAASLSPLICPIPIYTCRTCCSNADYIASGRCVPSETAILGLSLSCLAHGGK